MRRPLKTTGWVVAILLLFASPSWANQFPVISASGGNGPSMVTFVPEIAPALWSVQGAYVTRDTNFGPWVKVLETFATFDPNGVIWLEEFITIRGDVPWNDWHEEILPDPITQEVQWAWDSVMIFDVLSNGTNNHDHTNGSILLGAQWNTSPDGSKIWFDFPALGEGTTLHIKKGLVYTPNLPGGVASGSIRIEQYPTVVPEPGTMLLLGTGLAGLAGYARRRRKK